MGDFEPPSSFWPETPSPEPHLSRSPTASPRPGCPAVRTPSPQPGPSGTSNTRTTTRPKAIHTCCECKKNFKTARNLRRHIAAHDAKRRFACFLCGRAFTHQRTLMTHVMVHMNAMGFKCEDCGAGFRRVNDLRRHRFKEHGERHRTQRGRHVCPICSKEFPSHKNLIRHQLIHYGVQSFECGTCGKKFNQQANLQKHRRIHTKEKPFICQFCGKAFAQSENLGAHERSHSGEQPHSCEECGTRFTRKNNLNAHMKKFHPKPERHACRLCGKLFKTYVELLKHNRIACEKKATDCLLCGKRFATKCGLFAHVRTVHESDAKYECPQCYETFRTRQEFVTHNIRVHNVRDSTCPLCNRNFAKKLYLMRHIRKKHPEVESYQCSRCYKAFRLWDELQQHKIIGHDDRFFTCMLCGECFLRSKLADAHIRRQHRDVVQTEMDQDEPKTSAGEKQLDRPNRDDDHVAGPDNLGETLPDADDDGQPDHQDDDTDIDVGGPDVAGLDVQYLHVEDLDVGDEDEDIDVGGPDEFDDNWPSDHLVDQEPEDEEEDEEIDVGLEEQFLDVEGLGILWDEPEPIEVSSEEDP